jgi:hypothetical protein
MYLSDTRTLYTVNFGTGKENSVPIPGYYDYDNLCDPATMHTDGDFYIWCINRSAKGYRGNTFQSSTEDWRVRW